MDLNLLAFCLRSMYREYGSAFALRVILGHPVAAALGVSRYLRGGTATPAPWPGGAGSLVGIGFCLKPVMPACPAGRANHRCQVLEGGISEDCAPCRDCLVRAIGQQALASGSSVYVMTSAHDVLHDVLLPALLHRRFHSAVLTLCRYSFEPMRLALAICRIEARLVPFQHGDCRDYAAWWRADIGEKPERTFLDHNDFLELSVTLSGATVEIPAKGFQRVGNIYEPRRV